MAELMNSVERMYTVLRGGIPDRVPVGLMSFMTTAYESGMTFGDFFHSPEAMAEWQIRQWREFGHDMLMLENGTAALAEACGATVEYLKDSAPVVVAPAIKSLDDIGRLVLPDPFTNPSLAPLLATARIVEREIGDRAFIMGRADQGPFSLASLILGIDQFLVALISPEHTDALYRLLDFSLEACCRFAVAMGQAGTHITSIGESIAGPDVCSPRLYHKFEWPYAKRMVERLKEQDIYLSYHICGNATVIAGSMADTGAAVLELDYKVNLAKVKEAAGSKSVLLGPVDPSGVMATGTPAMVDEKCREAIEAWGPGGNFILGPGCALPPTTPHENIRSMIEAAHNYGQYAPDGSIHGAPA